MKPGNTERTLWDGDEVLAWLGTQNSSPEILFARGLNLSRAVGAGRDLSSFRISGIPHTVSLGGAMTASWDAPRGRFGNDWVTLYKPGTEYADYGDWEYTGGAQTGNASLSVPSMITGQYEPRYLVEDNYVALATGDTIAVGGGAGIFALTCRPWAVNPGESVVASWTAPTGRPVTDWVGLFKTTETDNHNYIARAYTNGTLSGKAVFSAPSDPGQYEIRYLRDDGFADVAVNSKQI